MNLTIAPQSIFKGLLSIIFILFFAHILGQIALFISDNFYLTGAARQFDFNQEANVPSLYATLTLLTCALLLFYIYWVSYFREKSFRIQWLLLSMIFIFLAMDEHASIHEVLMPILQDSYGFNGFLYYAWVIPYGIAVIVLSIAGFPFLLKLPKKIQSMFIISAVVFLTGAVGMELIGGEHDELFGQSNLQYVIYYTIEELLEMVGVAIFIYALLLYIQDFTNGSTIRLKLDTQTDEKANKTIVKNKAEIFEVPS